MENLIPAFCLMVGLHQCALESTVMKLGDDRFAIREQNHRLLEKQLNVCWKEFLIKRLKEDRNDAEINRRLDCVIEKLDSLVTDYGKYPWIDALPKNYPNRQKVIDEYLKKTGWMPAKDYPQYRCATYLWLKDLKRQGCWTSSLKEVQKSMIPNELYWIKNRKYPD